MATPVLIPVSEYLNTTYDPDCDYIDGEVIERNVGEKQHGLLQGLLFSIFLNNLDDWQLLPVTEQRVQVSPTKFRIPDLCLVRRQNSADPIVRVAPVVCIEILSRNQTLNDMSNRVSDYIALGVENIWILDPVQHEAWTATREGFVPAQSGVLTIPASPARIDLNEVFNRLDQLFSGRW
jgi:Uma2 family endonuclease